MTSPLENSSGPGKPLKHEPPDVKEFAGLERSRRVRLAYALNDSLSLEGRFDLAYNAAHALCLAALRWHGYRSTNRYIVFQLLRHTLGLGPAVWRVLSKCHDGHRQNPAPRVARADRQSELKESPPCSTPSSANRSISPNSRG